MKKLLILILIMTACVSTYSQNPSYQEKLYYTCKIWGFVRYNHSEVSTCKVNWDSVLIAKLPEIKAAITEDDFNNIIISMLDAAGQMEKAKYPFPYYIPQSLQFNRNFKWFKDKLIREDVRAILDTINVNVRPHENCFIKRNDGTGFGWLVYPKDNPIFNQQLSSKFPDEFTLLNGIFRYWSILSYYNPNNLILDVPWDRTLKNTIIGFAECKNYTDLLLQLRKMTAKLNDAHVEGMTRTIFDSYRPKLLIRKLDSQYVVLKSGYKEIATGDIIVSVNGKTVKEIEDSLSQYVSYGNPNVFGRFMNSYLLSGTLASEIKLEYLDSMSNKKSFNTYRYSTSGQWFSFTFDDELAALKWKVLNCNVAYVNMANLYPQDLTDMYNQIRNCSSIVFDVRNYPNNVLWSLAEILFPKRQDIAFFRMPDLEYPGTFRDDDATFGVEDNPDVYNGKVVVICDEETQSHAEYTCMMFRAMPNCTVVGSQTAGADGDVTRLVISLDLATGYTSLAPYYPDGTQTQRIGIVPDSLVYQTPESIRKKRDIVLEKALQIAGCPVSVNDEKNIELESLVYPNPFCDRTHILVNLDKDAYVSIFIYDMLGNKVKTITERFLSAGDHTLEFDGSRLPAGIYYYQIVTGNITKTQKLIITK